MDASSCCIITALCCAIAATIASMALAISGTSPWDYCEVLRGGAIVHWHTENHLVRLDKDKKLTKKTQKTQRKLSGHPSPQT